MDDERNKDTGLNQEDTANKQETEKTEQSQSTMPKTQEELDAVVEARIAREKRKWMKENKQQQQQKEQQMHTSQGGVQDTESVEQAVTPDPIVLNMQRDLVAAKMQLKAIQSNFRADVAEDAVYLAMRAVEQDGDDLDEASIQDALNDVKKRHPEWVVDDKAKGGFKVGADPDKKDTDQKNAMPMGTVIM